MKWKRKAGGTIESEDGRARIEPLFPQSRSRNDYLLFVDGERFPDKNHHFWKQTHAKEEAVKAIAETNLDGLHFREEDDE